MGRRRPANLGPERQPSTDSYSTSFRAEVLAMLSGVGAGVVTTVGWATELSPYPFHYICGFLGFAGFEITRRYASSVYHDFYPQRASRLGLALLAGASFSLAAAIMTNRAHPYEPNRAQQARYYLTDQIVPKLARFTFR